MASSHRHHRTALGKFLLQQIEKAHAVAAAGEHVNPQCVQFLRRHLGIAAAHTHHSIFIAFFRTADGIAGFLGR